MADRYAVYYAPPATGALWERAAFWLGRDAATGLTFDGPVAGMDRDRLLNFTGGPSRYGFHATLGAPMTLRAGFGEADLARAVADFAAGQAPLPLGPMTIAMIDGFLAIVPARQDEEVNAFSLACVTALEPLRAQLDDKARAARSADPYLSPRQRALIDSFGYPFVADQFRFHMTLTDRLDPEAAEEIRAVAAAWFAPVLQEACVLDSLSIFLEPEAAQTFRRRADFPLAASMQRTRRATFS